MSGAPQARRPIALILCGEVAPAPHARFGGYADHFTAALGLEPGDLLIRAAHREDPFPPEDSISGAILTGSPAMVGDAEPWMRTLSRWALDMLPMGVPILAVCFGHQLLSHALGGAVGPSPAGPEFGTTDVALLPSCDTDPLFHDLPPVLAVQQAHYQSVLSPPPGATRLGTSPADPNHILRLGPSAWSVQFHPERNADLSRAVVERNREPLRRLGVDAAGCAAAVRDSIDGSLLLRRFRALCAAAAGPRS